MGDVKHLISDFPTWLLSDSFSFFFILDLQNNVYLFLNNSTSIYLHI